MGASWGVLHKRPDVTLQLSDPSSTLMTMNSDGLRPELFDQ